MNKEESDNYYNSEEYLNWEELAKKDRDYLGKRPFPPLDYSDIIIKKLDYSSK